MQFSDSSDTAPFFGYAMTEPGDTNIWWRVSLGTTAVHIGSVLYIGAPYLTSDATGREMHVTDNVLVTDTETICEGTVGHGGWSYCNKAGLWLILQEPGDNLEVVEIAAYST